jgi:hypothetical protein
MRRSGNQKNSKGESHEKRGVSSDIAPGSDRGCAAWGSGRKYTIL